MEASSDSPLSTISKRLRLDNSLLWAAAFAFYLALRALVIANFNTSSALTILSEGGTSSVLLGTLITLVPVLAAGAYLIAVQSWTYARHTGANVTMSTLAILGGALAVLFLSPWFEAPVLILPLLLLLPEQILVRDLRRKERADLRQPLPDDPELMETETQIFQATVLSQDAARQADYLDITRQISDSLPSGTEEEAELLQRIEAGRGRLREDVRQMSTDLSATMERLSTLNAQRQSERQTARAYRLLGPLPEGMRSRYVTITAVATIAIMLAALVVALLEGHSWIPEENLSVVGLAGQRSAFVITSGQDWTTLLDPATHEVGYLRTSAIISREDCKPKDVLDPPSLYFLVTGQSVGQPQAVCAQLSSTEQTASPTAARHPSSSAGHHKRGSRPS